MILARTVFDLALLVVSEGGLLVCAGLGISGLGIIVPSARDAGHHGDGGNTEGNRPPHPIRQY